MKISSKRIEEIEAVDEAAPRPKATRDILDGEGE